MKILLFLLILPLRLLGTILGGILFILGKFIFFLNAVVGTLMTILGFIITAVFVVGLILFFVNPDIAGDFSTFGPPAIFGIIIGVFIMMSGTWGYYIGAALSEWGGSLVRFSWSKQ